jgi:tetratricopeptide (TPR) repeat protein
MPSTFPTLEVLPIEPPPDPATKGATSVPLGASTIERAPHVPVPHVPAPLELVPQAAAAAAAAPPAEGNAPEDTADRYLKEAISQYSKGHIDQPLWNRALAQAHGDERAAADLYLTARATALRLLDRERRSKKRAPVAPVARVVRQQLLEVAEPVAYEIETFLQSGALHRYRAAIFVGAAALLLLLAAGGWLLNAYLHRADSSAAARSVPVSAQPKPHASAVVVARPKGAGPELMKKIQELRDAENWNVLVFYLTEWTRLEPANPDAWDQLRADYVWLKQSDDALGAAKKAAELAPDNPRLLRHLGEAYADVNDVAAALAAYEKAVARDESDAESLTQIGILNAQMGRVPEAKVAIDRALAVSPGDATATCLKSGLAQVSTAPADSYATAKQVRAIDAQCRGTSVPVAPPAAAKPAEAKPANAKPTNAQPAKARAFGGNYSNR